MLNTLKPFYVSAVALGMALSLTACTAGQINAILTTPSAAPASARPDAGRALFSDALSRRILPIANSAVQASGASSTQPATAPAVSAPAPAAAAPAVGREMAKIAPGAAVDRMMMPWYGGGEFNQYVIQFAEETLFKPTQATTLLKAYSETVKPILSQWDASARLVESRANLGIENNPDFNEYISLPGRDGESEQIRPLYIFRFASTPRKETLNVYLLGKETRVHRMVWGEPQIDLARVRVDSSKARDLALRALTSQEKADYPIYPDGQIQDPNQQVIKEIPDNAQWQIQLNQQGREQSRYFVSVSFEVKSSVLRPVPEVIQKEGTRCFMDGGMPEAQAMLRVWGSVELDAATGAIQQVNRPVLYLPMYTPAMRCEPIAPPTAIPVPVEPQPVPLPVEPQPAPVESPSPSSESGADIRCITTPCP